MLYPLFSRNSHGKTSYAYWENFLSEEDIKYLLSVKEWDNLSDGQIIADAHRKVNNGQVVNKKIRETSVGWINVDKENQGIWSQLSNVTAEVNRKFFNFDLTGFHEPMQLCLYDSSKQGHYDWHIDGNPEDSIVPRKLSVVITLSDPESFEGGELQLKPTTDTPVTLEQKIGRAWFFPSYMLHRVMPVTKGVRRSAVLWAGGPEFK